MEIRKNGAFKNFYIPLILALVVIAAIVAVATSLGAREDAEKSAKSRADDVPVVATPSEGNTEKNTEGLPETKADSGKAASFEKVTKDETEDEECEPEEESASSDKDSAVPTFISPVGGVVIKTFSDSVPVYSETMNDYRVHTGVDVSAEEGEAVLAPADGTVGAVWNDPLMGNCMTIVHAGEFVTTLKGLAEEFPEGIAQGVAVTAGQPVATVGETALVEVAEEPHVHFELTASGVQISDVQTFEAAWLSSGSMSICEWEVLQDGAGTLWLSVNGGEEEQVSPGILRKRLASGSNMFAFRFEGAGAAYLKSFSDLNGTLLLFR